MKIETKFGRGDHVLAPVKGESKLTVIIGLKVEVTEGRTIIRYNIEADIFTWYSEACLKPAEVNKTKAKAKNTVESGE